MVSNSLKHRRNFWLAAGALGLAWAVVAAATEDSTQSAEVTSMTAAELADQIPLEQSPLILDVRSEKEYQEGHIPGALNIPFDQLPERLSQLAEHKDAVIVVHCRSGKRAEIAEKTLSEAGFTDVRDLEGHMDGWQSGGYPIEKP
jgi:phage shock protein E